MLSVNAYIIVIYDVITVYHCKCILLYSPLTSYHYVHWILDINPSQRISTLKIDNTVDKVEIAELLAHKYKYHNNSVPTKESELDELNSTIKNHITNVDILLALFLNLVQVRQVRSFFVSWLSLSFDKACHPRL